MSKKLTLEEIKEKLYNINPNIEILSDEYVNNGKKLKCICKIHNNVFHTAWAQLNAGHGCPVCGGSQPLTMDIVKNRMNYINPNIEILEDEHINTAQKVKCKCKIDGYEWNASIRNMLFLGRGCPKCAGNIRLDTKEALKRLDSKHDKIIFGKFEYVNNSTRVPCECKICNYKWYPVYNSLINGSGCPACKNKTVFIKHNDVAHERPDLIKYFKNKEDAYNHTCGSNKKIDMLCPLCGTERKFTVSELTKNGFVCNACSDSITLPNKMLFNTLRLSNSYFKPEFKIKGKNYRYDAMLVVENKRYVIECHGSQHYYEWGIGKSLKEEQLNDLNKKNWAVENGYDYIEVDCRESDLDFIKSNLINSLKDIIDIENIDWMSVYENSSTSLVYVASKLKNENNAMTTTEIGKLIGLSKHTTRKYLKVGTKLGLCNYNPEEEAYRVQVSNNKKSSKSLSKKILQVSIDGDIINEYESIQSASRATNISPSNICTCCKGRRNDAGGYKWTYKD